MLSEENKKGLGFSKALINTAINHLIGNCYFNVGFVTIKKTMRIPMGIDLARFWAIFFYTPTKKNTFHH